MVEHRHNTVANLASKTISPKRADDLAANLLGDLSTRLGGRQIAHARRVAAAVRRSGDQRTFAAALLHDVVETNRISLDNLLALTGDEQLVAFVDILTRCPFDTDLEYLARCARDPATLLIKRAELTDEFLAADATVEPVLCAQLRRQAAERLTVLGRLAGSDRPLVPEGDDTTRRRRSYTYSSTPISM